MTENPQEEQTVDEAPATSEADILIVDDTPANLRLLSGLLKQGGYRVRPVTEGRLALNAARKQIPDLILLDVNMPEMDGYEVCEALKADDQLSGIPVIFVSALAETTDKVRGFQVGGVDYITKPFQFEEVRARVETHLQIARLRARISKSNRKLRAANNRLTELTELEENLTNLIIHDLRGPLTGIMGYLELLQINSAGSLPEEFREDIDKALAVAQRMSEMINSLLDVARLEQATMPLKPTRCDLCELADEALTGIESLTEYRHVDVDLPDRPAMIDCDPGLIRRVITNLLHNALKFTSRDGRIKLAITTDDDGHHLSVEDNGPGIPEEYHDHVFDKFGISELKSRAQGPLPGLGLTFCKLCVEAHGGKIGYKSAQPRGTVFWFSIPEAK